LGAAAQDIIAVGFDAGDIGGDGDVGISPGRGSRQIGQQNARHPFALGLRQKADHGGVHCHIGYAKEQVGTGREAGQRFLGIAGELAGEGMFAQADVHDLADAGRETGAEDHNGRGCQNGGDGLLHLPAVDGPEGVQNHHQALLCHPIDRCFQPTGRFLPAIITLSAGRSLHLGFQLREIAVAQPPAKTQKGGGIGVAALGYLFGAEVDAFRVFQQKAGQFPGLAPFRAQLGGDVLIYRLLLILPKQLVDHSRAAGGGSSFVALFHTPLS